MLPTRFGNPLWFTDNELLELKGTTLYRATELQVQSSLWYILYKTLFSVHYRIVATLSSPEESHCTCLYELSCSIIIFSFLQKNSLQSLYENKVKKLVSRLLTLEGFSGRSV